MQMSRSETGNMMARIKRALSEPIDFEFIKFVDREGGAELFEVLGTTGNVYKVLIKRETRSTCTCQDFKNRGKMCKHIFCVLMKHYSLNITQISDLEKNPHLGLNDVPSSTSLRSDECECSICFQNIDTIEWVCERCQNHFHLDCVSEWFCILNKQNMPPSCPLCRHIHWRNRNAHDADSGSTTTSWVFRNGRRRPLTLATRRAYFTSTPLFSPVGCR